MRKKLPDLDKAKWGKSGFDFSCTMAEYLVKDAYNTALDDVAERLANMTKNVGEEYPIDNLIKEIKGEK